MIELYQSSRVPSDLSVLMVTVTISKDFELILILYFLFSNHLYKMLNVFSVKKVIAVFSVLYLYKMV